MTIRRLKRAGDELDELFARSVSSYVEIMQRLIRAEFDSDVHRKFAIEEELAELIGNTQALADLLGRRRLFLEIDAFKRRFSYADDTPVVPRVPFLEAVQSLLNREPRLARGWRAVQALYAKANVFALAKSASLALTKRVQKAIAALISRGETVDDASKVIAETGGFTRAYAETVYRTNLNSAYAAGRFQEAQEPEVQEIAPAFRYSAVMDSSTRPNHAAANNLVAATGDPVWDILTPPLGYNCRCALELVDRFTLKREGLLSERGRVRRAFIPTGAHPDEGFGKRPPISPIKL